MKSKNYSLVCYLEGEVLEKVQNIQQELFELTGSRKCVDAWLPHITLGSGITVPEDKQKETEQLFGEVALKLQTEEVALKGFNGIDNWAPAEASGLTTYVLWIDVEKTKELQSIFEILKTTITDDFETFYPRMESYRPHVTVAYGDLSEGGYEKGKEYITKKDFKDSMNVSHIAWVENFPDKDGEVKRFYFNKKIPSKF
jgi:2'-5' RNA ligase